MQRHVADPEGCQDAVLSRCGCVILPHRRLTGHAGPVYAVAIGRAGDRAVIVSAGQDGTLRRWDAVTGAHIGDSLTGTLVRKPLSGPATARGVRGGDSSDHRAGSETPSKPARLRFRQKPGNRLSCRRRVKLTPSAGRKLTPLGMSAW